MPWYEIYGCDEVFEKFYEKKPQLYKRHEKYFNNDCDDTYLAFANRYHPEDFDSWVSSLGKLFSYERALYAKVDKHNQLIIISYYSINYHSLRYDSEKNDYFETTGTDLHMRFIYDTETTTMYHYRMKNFRSIVYVLNSCDGNYQMGGWTDFDKFYTQYQRSLDSNSIAILKSLDKFKYLPIELFKKISVYKLFQINDDMIYQYEILLKNNLRDLASDLLLRREFINLKYIKRYKKVIFSGIRLIKLNELIRIDEENERKQREETEKEALKRVKKLTPEEKTEEFEKLPKHEYDLGEYILRYPKEIKELEYEGEMLNHCVAGYLDKIVAKISVVLFLRKKSEHDKPFFTVEIKNGSVTQVRTNNNKTDPEITKLVENWYKRRLFSKAA